MLNSIKGIQEKTLVGTVSGTVSSVMWLGTQKSNKYILEMYVYLPFFLIVDEFQTAIYALSSIL